MTYYMRPEFFFGTVESREDPLKLGRVKVRCLGFHTDEKNYIPTSGLPWAYPMLPITSASMNGIGETPLGLLEGSWVFGFFRDGTRAQEPIIIGSMGGIPEDVPNPSIGFNDPQGRYPKSTHINEPDTNRLARTEKLAETILATKNSMRDTGVAIANGHIRTTWDPNEPRPAAETDHLSWSQPIAPYNAVYPFNHVRETESGHILEFDDSPGTERIHLWHRTGSFIEYDRNGTRTNRVVGDSYEIIDRSGHIHIKGKCHITVDGESYIYVKTNAHVQVDGSLNAVVKNDANIDVSGTTNLSVGERTNVRCPDIRFESDAFSIKTGSFNLESTSTEILTSTMATTCEASYDLHTNEYARTSTGRSDIRFDGDRWTHIGADTYNRHDAGTDYSCPSDPVRNGGIDCTDVDVAADATAADDSGLVLPVQKATIQEPTFKPFNIVTRIDHVLQGHDDDTTTTTGLPEDVLVAAEKEGIISRSEANPKSGTVEKEEMKTGIPTNPDKTVSEEEAAMENIPDTTKVSTYFTLADFTTRPAASRFRLQPNAGLTEGEIFANIKNLAQTCADPIKAAYPDMMITSAFRASGSNPKSQHLKGQAMDIQFARLSTAKGLTLKQIREGYYDIANIISGMIPYDQFLLEFKNSGSLAPWIHISYTMKSNRGQILTFNNNALYKAGLVLIQV